MKPYEEVQVSNTAIWRWYREGDVYVNRMTQENMDQFIKDVKLGRSETMIIDEGCFERGCACVDTRVDSKWVKVEMREKL